jgi:hypothetical protein
VGYLQKSTVKTLAIWSFAWKILVIFYLNFLNKSKSDFPGQENTQK